jgi:hypothetical protein
MANNIPFIPYSSERGPQVGDTVCMICEAVNHATNPFSTSVIEAVKDGDVHIARPYCMVNSIGVAFVTMTKHVIGLDLFVEKYAAHSSGTKIDNVLG